MIKSTLAASKNGRELQNIDGYADRPVLITETYGAMQGTFDSVLLTVAGTFEIIADRGSDGIVLTDLLISAEKKALATLTIRFNDTSNTETIMLATLTDAPVNFAIPFSGHWEGWQGTNLEVVASHDIVGCVAVGYYRINEEDTLAYDAWTSRR
jgi:hypothetical protein